MKVIYSEEHGKHAPRLQFVGGAMVPSPETPDRVERIRQALQERPGFDVVAPAQGPEDCLQQVHDPGYLAFLSAAHDAWEATGHATDAGLIPDTFAVRHLDARPENLEGQAGYYCFETQTPILSGTFEAAVQSAYCALTGADALLSGEASAYALCRPPGHHASRDLYGGYCYLNNAAVAATRLVDAGPVAIVDIDYHHGNGTKQIFYERDDVTVFSIHADPDRKYPFFSGRASETGAGRGLGQNRNIPLEQGVGLKTYLDAVEDAVEEARSRQPEFLIVSLGVDTCREDPMSDFDLPRKGFPEIGKRLGALGRPTLFVQEGGYNLEAIGACVEGVLGGFAGSGSQA